MSESGRCVPDAHEPPRMMACRRWTVFNLVTMVGTNSVSCILCYRTSLLYLPAGKAWQLKTFQWHDRLRVTNHAAQEFAEQEAEFEAVTREARGKNDAWLLRQVVKDEIFVGGYFEDERVKVRELSPMQTRS